MSIHPSAALVASASGCRRFREFEDDDEGGQASARRVAPPDGLQTLRRGALSCASCGMVGVSTDHVERAASSSAPRPVRFADHFFFIPHCAALQAVRRRRIG